MGGGRPDSQGMKRPDRVVGRLERRQKGAHGRGEKVRWHQPHIHKQEAEGRNVKRVTHPSPTPHPTAGGRTAPPGAVWSPRSSLQKFGLAQPGASPWLPAAIVWPLGQCPLPLLLLPPPSRLLGPLMNSHHAVLRYAVPTGLPAGWPLECQAASPLGPPPTCLAGPLCQPSWPQNGWEGLLPRPSSAPLPASAGANPCVPAREPPPSHTPSPAFLKGQPFFPMPTHPDCQLPPGHQPAICPSPTTRPVSQYARRSSPGAKLPCVPAIARGCFQREFGAPTTHALRALAAAPPDLPRFLPRFPGPELALTDHIAGRHDRDHGSEGWPGQGWARERDLAWGRKRDPPPLASMGEPSQRRSTGPGGASLCLWGAPLRSAPIPTAGPRHCICGPSTASFASPSGWKARRPSPPRPFLGWLVGQCQGWGGNA